MWLTRASFKEWWPFFESHSYSKMPFSLPTRMSTVQVLRNRRHHVGTHALLGEALSPKALCEYRPENGSDYHHDQHRVDQWLVNEPNSCRILGLKRYQRCSQSGGDLWKR